MKHLLTNTNKYIYGGIYCWSISMSLHSLEKVSIPSITQPESTQEGLHEVLSHEYDIDQIISDIELLSEYILKSSEKERISLLSQQGMYSLQHMWESLCKLSGHLERDREMFRINTISALRACELRLSQDDLRKDQISIIHKIMEWFKYLHRYERKIEGNIELNIDQEFENKLKQAYIPFMSLRKITTSEKPSTDWDLPQDSQWEDNSWISSDNAKDLAPLNVESALYQLLKATKNLEQQNLSQEERWKYESDRKYYQDILKNYLPDLGKYIEETTLIDHTAVKDENWVYFIEGVKKDVEIKESDIVFFGELEDTYKWTMVCKDEKWISYLFTKDKKVELKYDAVYKFCEGRAQVKKDGKCWYINEEWEEVIKCQYRETYGFKDWIAWAVIENEEGKRYRFHIDENGSNISNDIYSDIEDFQDWVARVQKEKKRWLIDRNGKKIMECKYERRSKFSEWLAQVYMGWMRGYINTKGELVIKCEYDRVNPFKDGIAQVKKWYLWYIDKDWKEVIKCKYQELGEFEEWKATMKIGDKLGNIDIFWNEIIVEGEYDAIKIISEWRVVIRKQIWSSSKYGYVDEQWNPITECIYDRAESFKWWVARVGKFKKERNSIYRWLIDRNGEEITEYKYRHIGEFVNGLARVSTFDKTWFINQRGEEIVECKYQKIKWFKDGLAIFQISGDCFLYSWYMNQYGKEVIPADYHSRAGDFSYWMAKVEKVDKGYWVINKRNHPIIDFQYFDLVEMGDDGDYKIFWWKKEENSKTTEIIRIKKNYLIKLEKYINMHNLILSENFDDASLAEYFNTSLSKKTVDRLQNPATNFGLSNPIRKTIEGLVSQNPELFFSSTFSIAPNIQELISMINKELWLWGTSNDSRNRNINWREVWKDNAWSYSEESFLKWADPLEKPEKIREVMRIEPAINDFISEGVYSHYTKSGKRARANFPYEVIMLNEQVSSVKMPHVLWKVVLPKPIHAVIDYSSIVVKDESWDIITPEIHTTKLWEVMIDLPEDNYSDITYTLKITQYQPQTPDISSEKYSTFKKSFELKNWLILSEDLGDLPLICKVFLNTIKPLSIKEKIRAVQNFTRSHMYHDIHNGDVVSDKITRPLSEQIKKCHERITEIALKYPDADVTGKVFAWISEDEANLALMLYRALGILSGKLDGFMPENWNGRITTAHKYLMPFVILPSDDGMTPVIYPVDWILPDEESISSFEEPQTEQENDVTSYTTTTKYASESGEQVESRKNHTLLHSLKIQPLLSLIDLRKNSNKPRNSWELLEWAIIQTRKNLQQSEQKGELTIPEEMKSFFENMPS